MGRIALSANNGEVFSQYLNLTILNLSLTISNEEESFEKGAKTTTLKYVDKCFDNSNTKDGVGSSFLKGKVDVRTNNLFSKFSIYYLIASI